MDAGGRREDKKPGQGNSTEDWPEATTEDEARRGNLVDKPPIAAFLPRAASTRNRDQRLIYPNVGICVPFWGS